MQHLFSWELLYSQNCASGLPDASGAIFIHSINVCSTPLPEHFALLKGQEETCVVSILLFTHSFIQQIFIEYHVPGTLIGFRNTTVMFLTMLYYIYMTNTHPYISCMCMCEKITSFLLIGNLIDSNCNRLLQHPPTPRFQGH